jgi:predicted aconitase
LFVSGLLHVPREFDPKPLLRTLLAYEVDFVLIGGLAGLAHGSSYPTYDIDIAHARDPTNLERLGAALRALGATADHPLENGGRLTFETRYGRLDILSDPDLAHAYERLRAGAGEPQDLEGEQIRIASLDHLIAMKEAVGRTKDKLMATEYRVLSDEIRTRE